MAILASSIKPTTSKPPKPTGLADLRANLIHPAIPRILGYFATETHSYLVQEFIPGANLETVLEEYPGFLPEQRIVTWAIQLCQVLDFLHNHPTIR